VSDFDTFYAANVGRLTVQLYAYCADFAEAQDLVQEAFVRALARWPRLSRYDDPVAWVRRVAWNLATSRWRYLRVARAHAHLERPDPVAPPSPDRVALSRALATLPATQRRTLVLYYLADLSVAEIAQQEGVAEGTVRSSLHRGRAALAQQLRGDPVAGKETHHG
jgi:RNA polymerase sigma-70 factor, ECF subfamily